MLQLKNLSKYYQTTKGLHLVFKDLNLDIPEGKNVGILGRNGAGKSTLLRIMGGIDYPTSGEIVTDKQISWPVGLMGGFQGSLTGKENAKFVCRLYELDEAAMQEKLAWIEEFAEIAEYFYMPVKTFSSGMKARLAFAISMAFEFDYYLIDEITAVGDKLFKDKCDAIVQEKRKTSNVLMVSHDMHTIRRDCDIAILLQKGSALLFDDVNEAITAYEKAGK